MKPTAQSQWEERPTDTYSYMKQPQHHCIQPMRGGSTVCFAGRLATLQSWNSECYLHHYKPQTIKLLYKVSDSLSCLYIKHCTTAPQVHTATLELLWLQLDKFDGTVDSLQPPLGPIKVSWLERWPHFRGKLLLNLYYKSLFWDFSKWPEYRGGHISGVQIRGSSLSCIRQRWLN